MKKVAKVAKPQSGFSLIPTKPQEFSLFGVGSIENGILSVSLAQITAKNAFTIGNLKAPKSWESQENIGGAE